MDNRVGIDIDGCVVDIIASCQYFLKKQLKRDVNRNEITTYNLDDKFDIDRDALDEYFKSPRAYRFPFIWQSVEAMCTLKWFGYDLYAVTARPKDVHDFTKKWIHEKKLPFSDVVFVNAHSKIDIAKELNLAYFVEDRLETALDLGSECRKVFLIDAPYNKELSLPLNIIRCYSWDAVSREMVQEYAKNSIEKVLV